MYGTGFPITCRRPANAGPPIIAACITEVCTATVRASEPRETPAARSGPIAGPAKAFPAPFTNAST